MAKPQPGDVVHVNYTGRLLDGSQFDSSEGREPLAFILGNSMVIPGFDAAVADLEVGEKITVTIPVEEAYGPHEEGLIQMVPKDFFQGESPEVGWVVQLQSPDGQVMAASIEAISDEGVTLDLNHPLAGQDLVFDLELVEIGGEMPEWMSAGCDDEDCAGCGSADGSSGFS
ncbi:MAG: peptidylprolyl isomerase [Coriobacteriia bacterium]|nr:peptidylprolyl isomerase [Coriobacteriia bacterium]